MTEINSPCIRNCCLNEQDVCMGCFRNLDEIRSWSASSDEEKTKILDLANARKKAYKNQY